ncbi:MAG: hypothetical protein H7Y30_02500 [Pyrinomonadaceae bacterium]|nr:hypothetical protein [Pyrinomonadaceae bacterium]
MPVTIGTLTSSVQVSDGGGGVSDETTERIIQMAVARMKQVLRDEIEAKKDSDPQDRRSEAEPD